MKVNQERTKKGSTPYLEHVFKFIEGGIPSNLKAQEELAIAVALSETPSVFQYIGPRHRLLDNICSFHGLICTPFDKTPQLEQLVNWHSPENYVYSEGDKIRVQKHEYIKVYSEDNFSKATMIFDDTPRYTGDAKATRWGHQ